MARKPRQGRSSDERVGEVVANLSFEADLRKVRTPKRPDLLDNSQCE